MSAGQLKKLIEGGESETTEFKQSFAETAVILETICAFANTKGGKVLVGVSDEGEILGAEVGKDTLEKIPQRIRESFDPNVFPSVNSGKIEDKSIVVIEVSESREKPVFYKNIAYKRVGKANRKLSASEVRKLAKESGEKVYWDGQVCKNAGIGDVDWDFVNTVFIPLYEEVSEKKVASDPKNLLEAIGCLKNGAPTNAGVLLFGKNPQKFFINAFIALARYRGKTVDVERLDYKEFKGNLFQQIDNCDKYIKEHIAIMSILQPDKIQRQDIPEYGLFSIRELLMNAVCHRDYTDQGGKVIIKMFDDSMEFYNIGGLRADITPENITQKQYSRNPIIAGVFAKVKYIEEMGEGWDKILKEHKEHQLEPNPPTIVADAGSVLVTLYSTKDKFERERLEVELNERQKKALQHVKEYGRITNKDYRKLFPEISDRTVLSDLMDMVKKKILTKKGKTKGSYYTLHNSEIIPK